MPGCKTIVAALLFLSVDALSQATQRETVDITRLSIVAPGISIEKSTGRWQTIQAQAFLNIGFAAGYSSSMGSSFFFNADPAFGLQYRVYYNGQRRNRLGKRTAMNSMNYLAPVYNLVYSSGSISDSYYGEHKRRLVHNMGIVWGMQRNYAKRFSIDISAGPGLLFAKTSLYYANDLPAGTKTAAAFELLLQLRLGLWLNRNAD